VAAAGKHPGTNNEADHLSDSFHRQSRVSLEDNTSGVFR
jgi:hypothetical protein